jgi:nitrite reductase/ring-hydroxylating ferredoxin subunit/uncharacterized membrane protein
VRSGGSHCPFGQDEMYGREACSHNGLIHEVAVGIPKVIPEVVVDVDGLWILWGGGRSMAHWLTRLVAAQDRWARPFGDFNHRWLSAVFRPIRPVKDFLNGTWLGHPIHAAITDVPIGTLVVVVVLDILGYTAAADVAVVTTVLFMLVAAVTGAADYTDTDGTARSRATVHSTLMVVALVLLVLSLGLRAGGAADRTVPIGLSIVALVFVSAGAFVGGHVVYVLGNMVSRHAFRGAGTKWIRLDTGDLVDLAELEELTPTKARAGINDLVLVRVGDTVQAMHAVCAHAGGPLAEGAVEDGCLVCPWHGSRFRLTDGHLRRGPSVYDQPHYEIRAVDGGGYEVRRTA